MLCSFHAAYTEHDKFQGLREDSCVHFKFQIMRENTALSDSPLMAVVLQNGHQTDMSIHCEEGIKLLIKTS